MVEKKFKISAVGVMTSLIISTFWKNYAKNGKNMYFCSKINLVAARKKDFGHLSSAFKSQDNIQTEYIDRLIC